MSWIDREECFRTPSRLPSKPALPDPLTHLDGRAVESVGGWEDRREELKALFRHYVYGYAPDPFEVRAKPISHDAILDDRGSLRTVELSFPTLSPEAPTIRLSVLTPAGEESVPVILGLNRSGNHTLLADDRLPGPGPLASEDPPSRGSRADFWCVETILDRGFGLASFHHDDIAPDRDAVEHSIVSFVDESSLAGPSGSEWGLLARWAWGLQHAVDYLLEAPDVDPDAIGVIGHSRRGKAALLAGATDERIALVVPHQSGTGGCALARGNDQETIAAITRRFPHWFADRFHAFAGRPDRLPVDQHLLIALVAPRPLMDTEGSRDYWANPGLALDAIRGAGPVYDWYGADGVLGDGLLVNDDPIDAETVGALVQYRRETGHTLNEAYWEKILDFAAVHFE